jgi:hypothetical protein
MEEFERLVSTLSYRTVARVTQTRSHLDPAAVLGEGKLKELGAPTGGGTGWSARQRRRRRTRRGSGALADRRSLPPSPRKTGPVPVRGHTSLEALRRGWNRGLW